MYTISGGVITQFHSLVQPMCKLIDLYMIHAPCLYHNNIVLCIVLYKLCYPFTCTISSYRSSIYQTAARYNSIIRVYIAII